MSAAKHTPWTINEGTGPGAEVLFHEIRDTNGRILASTWASPNIELARLIAASPSMYSLLQDAHDFIDAQSDVNRDGDGPNWAMSLAASIREVLDKVDAS